MSKTWYVVMALQSWDSLAVGPYKVGGVDDTNAPARWIAAFDDRKKAEAWADGKAAVIDVRIAE